jgi:hypothetical protein
MIEILPQRLQDKLVIVPPADCWIWTGATADGGYGEVKILGTRRNMPAHRMAYEILRGSIPAGLVLDHKCRVTCCCNPDHLEITTHRTNILRGTSPSAHNARKLVCDNGHSMEDAYTGDYGRKCRICQKANVRRWYWENGGRERRSAKTKKRLDK